MSYMYVQLLKSINPYLTLNKASNWKTRFLAKNKVDAYS